jgi:hypothetical protein
MKFSSRKRRTLAQQELNILRNMGGMVGLADDDRTEAPNHGERSAQFDSAHAQQVVEEGDRK